MSAIDPVTIDFAVRGLTDVTKAFQTVEQRMARFEKEATGHAVTESQTRLKVARAEGKEREKTVGKTAKEAALAEKRITETALAEGKKVLREVERLESYKLRVRQRSAEMAGQYAARQAAEEIRAAERASAAWGRVATRAGAHVTGAANRALGGAAMTLAIGGGAMVADAVKRQLSAERSAALFINQVTAKGIAPPGATVAAVLGQASQVSKETGMTKEEVIEGTRAYAKTARGGDYKGAMANMGFFAKMSKVTGVEMSEISGAAGMLQSQNRELASDPKKMQQMLLDILAQTKSGSLGMTEMIAQSGRIGSVRGAFAGDESTNQRKLLALGQIVSPAAGAESGIMIADLALEATTGAHLGKAKAAGVKFDARNRIESPEQMIAAVLRSSNGDLGKINDIFGKRGGTLLRELSTGYTAARDAGGKGDAGIKAGDKYLTETIGSVTSSTMSAGDLTQQFEQMMSTPAERFQTALNSLIDTLEDRVEPYLGRLADKLPALIPKFEAIIDEAGKLASWLADNPLKGAGAIALAAITADLTNAGIGAAVRIALTGLMTGTGAAGVLGKVVSAGTGIAGGLGGALMADVGTVAAGAAGVAGTVTAGGAAILGAAGLAALAVGGGIGYGLSEGGLALQHEGQTSSSNSDIAATNAALKLEGKVRAGTVTQKDVEDAQKLKPDLEETAKRGPSWFADSNAETKNAAATLALMSTAIEAATKKLQAMAAAAGDVKNDPGRSDTIDARNPPHP